MTLALIILATLSIIHHPLFEIVPDNYKRWYWRGSLLFSLYAMRDLHHLPFIGVFLFFITTISLSIILRLIVDWLKQNGRTA